MVPVAMVLFGIGLGVFIKSPRKAHGYLGAAFVIVLAVQSIVVFGPGHGSIRESAAYWLVQLVSLAVGLALLNVGLALNRRRSQPAAG